MHHIITLILFNSFNFLFPPEEIEFFLIKIIGENNLF